MSRIRVPNPHGLDRDGRDPGGVIPAPLRRASVDPLGLLTLQRLAGNRAVTALIQSGNLGGLGVQRATLAPTGPATGPDAPPGQGVDPAAPLAAQRSCSCGGCEICGTDSAQESKVFLEGVEQVVQREATRPRAVAGAAAIADFAGQTAAPASGRITAGSLARREWESLFRRHFIEPDQIEDEVESSHARYIFSQIYGWIDAQHFFAHIQFAEESGLEGATAEGISIERRQEQIRSFIGPDPDDPTIYSELLRSNLITPDDFLHYRENLFIAMSLALPRLLNPQQRALIAGFDDRQFAKLILDNVMSAWSAEDLISNQLGVQFFRLHGAHINAGADGAAVRQRFIERLETFFSTIQVVNNPAAVRRLARSLPGKERWTSAKMNEQAARRRFPELFAFSAATHRVRIAIYDRRARADEAREEIQRVMPSLPLHVAPYGRGRHGLYTGGLSHFDAVIAKHAIDRAVPTGLSGALVEPQP